MKTTKPKAVSKSPAKVLVKVKVPKNSQEATLSRIETVCMGQREDGNFDCFGRASEGYCYQGGCCHRDECLSVSQLSLS